MGTLTDFINSARQAINDIMVDQLFPIVLAIAVALIVWAGYLYIMNKPEDAKKVIESVIVGLIIISLATLIINFIVTAAKNIF